MGLTGEQIVSVIADYNQQAIILDGLDEALVGYIELEGFPIKALYDTERVIEILVKRDGMTLEEAEEYFDYNIRGLRVGDCTPAFATILK